MKIAIQTDAYPEIGTGHLMRCLTLAEGLNDNGHEFFFVTYCENNTLFERLKKENFVLYLLKTPTSLEESKEIFKKESPEWVVLDGYHFSPEYQRAIKDSGYKLLVIDDYAHLEHYYANIILNQNYGAEKFSYNAEPHTRFLLGTKYVLLRWEFLHYSNYKRQIPDMAQKVLITMGGGDPENNTLRVLRAVNLIETPLNVRVIIGVSNPHYAPIKKKADESRHNIEILRDVKGMAPLMAWADVAVSAGGTTTWELAFMGLPSLLCIVADNQEFSVNALVKDKVFHSVGWIKDKSPIEISSILRSLIEDTDVRKNMSKRMRSIVDGKGIKRAIEAMEKESKRSDDLSINLRRDIDFEEIKFINFVNLTHDDKEMVRNWRNADEIRKWMFTDHMITKDEHLNFIESLKNDKANFYWMVTADSKPVGVCSLQKIDFRSRSCYLGIYSAKKGFGKAIIKCLLYLWFELIKMGELKCEVIEDNKYAYNFYKNNGFTETGMLRFIRKDNINKKVISMSIMKENIDKQLQLDHVAYK